MRAKELIDYLTDQGYNVFPDPNFIPADLQESQLPALFVFGTGGYQANDHFKIDFPTFQVHVIGKNYKLDSLQMDAAEQYAQQLIKHFEKKEDYFIGVNHVEESRSNQSNPIPLGLDNNDRPNYSTNFIFKIRG